LRGKDKSEGPRERGNDSGKEVREFKIKKSGEGKKGGRVRGKSEGGK
jgi:hypothetical protein